MLNSPACLNGPRPRLSVLKDEHEWWRRSSVSRRWRSAVTGSTTISIAGLFTYRQCIFSHLPLYRQAMVPCGTPLATLWSRANGTLTDLRERAVLPMTRQLLTDTSRPLLVDGYVSAPTGARYGYNRTIRSGPRRKNVEELCT